MEVIAEKDHHKAYFVNGIIRVYNPRGIIGEFSLDGEVCGVFQPVSRWESNTAKAVKDIAIKNIKSGRN